MVGDEFEPTDEVRAFLMRDAPACFEVVEPPKPKPRRKQARPRNKAILDAPEDK